jgi:hypothetical protein
MRSDLFFRVFMMSTNPPWTSSVGLSQQTPQASSRLKASASKSISSVDLITTCSLIFPRWGQANARKGQAGVEPQDVYGSRT